MPVRSLNQSVLLWPKPELILAAVQQWAEAQQVLRPALAKVGVFGSYGRGDAGVGSDLDLLLVDGAATGPQQQRLLSWPLERLPLSCDALVLTQPNFRSCWPTVPEWRSNCRAICVGCFKPFC